jgi:hypothetical protein
MLIVSLALGWALGTGAAERPLDRFLADLQDATVRNDRRAIAGMVHYPIKVLASGWIIPIDDRATFVRYFDAFFTDEIRDLIADAAERPGTRAVPDVVKLGVDNIRIMRFDGRFRIIGITVPPSSGKVRGARRGTTVVSLAGGQGTASFSGTLARGEHESYRVHAARNDLIEVRVDRVRGRDIVARVLDAVTRTPLDTRGQDGARVWTGRVPATGDYLVDIVRATPTGDPVLTYMLTVSVR